MTVKVCQSCRSLFDGSGNRCQTCINKRKTQQSVRPTVPKVRDAVYGTDRWRRLSERKRRVDPLCEDCKDVGIVRPAEMVDHIDEIKDGGAVYDWLNLRSRCWPCHAAKTARVARERKAKQSSYLSFINNETGRLVPR